MSELRPLTYPDATRRLAAARARAAGRAERQQEHLKRHMNTTHEEQLRVARDESRNDAMRRAIAEACGWKQIINDSWACGWVGLDPKDGVSDELPNYPADLNAMHKAEKVLTQEQRIKARWMLVQLLDGWRTWSPEDYNTLNVLEMSLWDIDECVSATAIQRAEAFCRTLKIGPYKEATT